MAHTTRCDACHMATNNQFEPGWGRLSGTDTLGGYVTHDLCPRCSNVMQIALGELRRKLTAPGATPEAAGAAEDERPGLLRWSKRLL